MSNPQGEQPKDTPLSVTPNNMPGADKGILPAIVKTDSRPQEFASTDVHVMEGQTKPETKTEEPKPDEGQGKSEAEQQAEVVEMERFKAVQRIAREQEKRATQNQADAEAYRKLAQLFNPEGNGNGDNKPDPLAEIQKLRDELNSERVERTREQIASATGVPASLVSGSTEDEMRASATAAQEWAKGLAKSASGKPLVAPAESVNSSQAPHETGVKQIQSRDELKGMSSKDILQAYKDGRMDHLMGKPQ